MSKPLRWLVRAIGFAFVLGALYPFVVALRWLDRREPVYALLAALVGWLVLQAGVEFVRPDSAE